jgi:hypothetical protein
MEYYVYALIDPRNQLPFYIGKGKIVDNQGRKYRRVKDHQKIAGNNKLKNSVSKKILQEFGEIPYKIIKEGLSELESFDLEKGLIAQYGRRDLGSGILTNLTDGGEGQSGLVRSEIFKKKISERNKEYYRNHPNPFLGKKHSEESRIKMSKGQKRYLKDNKNSFEGKSHTEESKAKMSAFRKAAGTTLPKEKWFLYASKGGSKNYTFISPDGEKFEVKGEFCSFVKSKKLALSTCKEFINKGKIPEPKNPKHNRMTPERLNSTNWEIIKTSL